MRLLAAVVAVAFGTALTTAAPVPKDKQKTTAEKLVGTWELVKNSKENVEGAKVFVEFTKDGKMSVKFVPNDKDVPASTFNGKFKVLEGEKVDYPLDTGEEGKTRQEVLTIKKLTDDELVTVDPNEIQEDFKRVKEKK